MTANKGKHRERVLAAITVVVVLGVILFTTIIEPQLKHRKELTVRLRLLQLKLSKMKGDLLVKDRIDNIYSQIEPLIADCGTEQQEISVFARELADLYSKLKPKSVRILPTVKTESHMRLSVRIEMQGHVRDIFDFIQSIAQHPSPVKIEQFNLNVQDIVDNANTTFLVTKIVTGPKT